MNINPDKVKASKMVESPSNVSELKSFLCSLEYYRKYISDMSIILYPLYELLKKGKTWNWSKDCKKSFDTIKDKLSNAPTLAHYDLDSELVLTCDASPFGIAAVLNIKKKRW